MLGKDPFPGSQVLGRIHFLVVAELRPHCPINYWLVTVFSSWKLLSGLCHATPSVSAIKNLPSIEILPCFESS